MFCPTCHEGVMRESARTYEVHVTAYPNPVTVRVTGVPALLCGSCGDVMFRGDTAERAELLASRVLVERGFRVGGVLRLARKTLGYRASDLAGLLGVANETVSRWENDHFAVDPATWVTLGSLIADELGGDRETLNRLAAARESRVPTDCEIAFDRPHREAEIIDLFAAKQLYGQQQLSNAAPAQRQPAAAPAPVSLTLDSMSG